MELKPILLDTNVLILALAGKEPYAAFLKKTIEEKTLLLSAIVVAEFLSGATEEEEKLFSALTGEFPVVSVDLPVSQLAAFYRKKYRSTGRKLKLPDCLIAATAKAYRATLITLDKSDYPQEDIEIVSKI